MTSIPAYQIESILESTAWNQLTRASMAQLKRIAKKVWSELGFDEDRLPHIYANQTVSWMVRNEGLVHFTRLTKNEAGSCTYFRFNSGRFSHGDVLITMNDRSAVTLLHEMAHALLYERGNIDHEHGDDFMNAMEEVLGTLSSRMLRQYRATRELTCEA